MKCCIIGPECQIIISHCRSINIYLSPSKSLFQFFDVILHLWKLQSSNEALRINSNRKLQTTSPNEINQYSVIHDMQDNSNANVRCKEENLVC